MSTLKSLIITTIHNSKKALRRNEIFEKLIAKRYVNQQTLDSTLHILSKEGLVSRVPLCGERAKFAYTRPAKPKTLPVLVKTVLSSDKMDSYEVWAKVSQLDSTVTKQEVDSTLFRLSREGRIIKSKTPMTDSNITSTQSKYLYSI